MPMTPSPTFPGPASDWHGFPAFTFTAGERAGTAIVPHEPLPGRLWAWKGEFLDAFPANEIQLLERGVYIVYLEIPNLLGCPTAVGYWNECYSELTGTYGMAPKPALIGLSRGGLYCYNWAISNPDKVACIYGDAPVCDLKSWPGGRGEGSGSPQDWQLAMKVYGFEDEVVAMAYGGNPVDNLQPLARAGVPLLHVYGDADEVVPWTENTKVIADRYRVLGGDIQLIGKPGVKHHPHGLEDPAPTVDFVIRHLESANRV